MPAAPRGFDLSHAVLRGAYLRHADLRVADLFHADLEGASLQQARISGARFPRSLAAEEIRLSHDLGTRLRCRGGGAVTGEPAAGTSPEG